MNPKIESLKKTRRFLLDKIKDLSIEQLNKVPDGFRNNIIWNVGHLISAQQGICYLLANQPAAVESSILTAFRKGTQPGDFVDEEMVERIKAVFIDSVDQLAQDYEEAKFTSYNTFHTPYGVELTSIDDALEFVSFHEGMHTGYVMAMMHLV